MVFCQCLSRFYVTVAVLVDGQINNWSSIYLDGWLKLFSQYKVLHKFTRILWALFIIKPSLYCHQWIIALLALILEFPWKFYPTTHSFPRKPIFAFTNFLIHIKFTITAYSWWQARQHENNPSYLDSFSPDLFWNQKRIQFYTRKWISCNPQSALDSPTSSIWYISEQTSSFDNHSFEGFPNLELAVLEELLNSNFFHICRSVGQTANNCWCVDKSLINLFYDWSQILRKN